MTLIANRNNDLIELYTSNHSPLGRSLADWLKKHEIARVSIVNFDELSCERQAQIIEGIVNECASKRVPICSPIPTLCIWFDDSDFIIPNFKADEPSAMIDELVRLMSLD